MSLFCKVCDNILEISRNSNSKLKNIYEETNELDLNDIIYKLETNKELSNQELNNLEFDSIIKSKLYQKKNTKIKNKIKKNFEELINKKEAADTNISAYYLCKNCGFNEPIKGQRIIISRLSEEETDTDLQIISKLKNKLHSRIIPRTREYICPNKSCKTHKDTPNEAVFFKTRDQKQLWYGCTVCEHIWRIS